jgi:hypothetical protein
MCPPSDQQDMHKRMQLAKKMATALGMTWIKCYSGELMEGWEKLWSKEMVTRSPSSKTKPYCFAYIRSLL